MPAADPSPVPRPTTAYVALGANLGDRPATLRAALDLLAAAPGLTVTAISSFLENPAVGGPAGQPAFLNAVAEVRTTLGPRAMLGVLLDVERQLGRERRERWGPRTIDLDLVLFGDAVIADQDLKVPHPLMHERAFVLTPLAEVAPAAVHPVLGRTAAELAANLAAGDRPPRGTGFQPVRDDAPPADADASAGLAGPTAAARVENPCHGGGLAPAVPSGDAAPPPAIALRPATSADGPAVRDLVFAVLREHGLTPDPCGADLDLLDLEGTYARAGGRFDVLVNPAGHVLGSVGLHRADAGTAELRKMYLHRSVRGQGWGRRLLDHALAEARRLGVQRVTLETAAVLADAVRLYERNGFVRLAGEACKVGRCDAVYERTL
ncbi:MAG: folK [Phycisphaerales bacterium]|nr:folK [Phycisphaerales bacterium]